MSNQGRTSRRRLIGAASVLAFGGLLRRVQVAVLFAGCDERAKRNSEESPARSDSRNDSQAAPTELFMDNGDGTVTDPVSGLMWQKVDGGPMTLEAAQKYAEQLELAGHSDWRLPLPMELFCIMDHRLHGPAMNTRRFPASEARYWWTEIARPDLPGKYFSDAESVSCWSSTTQQNRPERAWVADFTSGLVTYRDKTESMWVLAVRGNSQLTAEPTEPVSGKRKGESGKRERR